MLLVELPLVQMPRAAPPSIVVPATMQGVVQPLKAMTSESDTRVALSPKLRSVTSSTTTREQFSKERPERPVVPPPSITPPEMEMNPAPNAEKAVTPDESAIVPSISTQVRDPSTHVTSPVIRLAVSRSTITAVALAARAAS